MAKGHLIRTSEPTSTCFLARCEALASCAISAQHRGCYHPTTGCRLTRDRIYIYIQTLISNFDLKLWSQTLISNFDLKLWSQTLISNFNLKLWSQTLISNFDLKLWSHRTIENQQKWFDSRSLPKYRIVVITNKIFVQLADLIYTSKNRSNNAFINHCLLRCILIPMH